MSDQQDRPHEPTPEELTRIYGASPGGKVDLPPADVEGFDQEVYNRELAKGMTPEAAKAAAERATHLKRVYARSRARGAMRP